MVLCDNIYYLLNNMWLHVIVKSWAYVLLVGGCPINLFKNQQMLIFRQIFTSLGLLAIAGVVQAAPIILNGDHFTVSYDDTQAAAVLYDQGKLSSPLDTFYFEPSNLFKASSNGSLTSTLQLTLTIDNGYAFAGLSFAERGYSYLRSGAADVVTAITLANLDSTDSALLSLASGPISQTGIMSWELTGDIGPQSLGAPQRLLITLDSDLAVNGRGSLQKTYTGFRIETAAAPAAIPEPASWVLLLVGMMAALLVGVRGRAARV
jgi:hypothetical protein